MTATRVPQPAACGRPPAAGRFIAGGAGAAGAVLLLLAVAAPAAGVEYYRSDAHGTRLARLEGAAGADAGYTLAVDAADEAQAAGLTGRRRLLHGGAVVTEWRRTAEGDGSVERELRAGRVAAERRFDDAGRLLEESRYGAAGELLQRAVLTYRGGALRRIHRYDGAGRLTATEEYELTGSGRLRGFFYTPAGAHQVAGAAGGSATVAGGGAPAGNAAPEPGAAADPGGAREPAAPAGAVAVFFLFHRGELIEERGRQADTEAILRFRDGEQVAAEQWRGELLVNERTAGARTDHTGATRTEITVDGAGQVQSERVYDLAASSDAAAGAAGGDDARLLEERNYRYRDDGSVRSLQVLGQSGLETVDYEFGDDGRLVREQVRRRGRLVRVITYPAPGERVEEVHADGATVLRVTWLHDRPIREELLRDGEVVRTRELTPDAAPGRTGAAGTS